MVMMMMMMTSLADPEAGKGGPGQAR